MKDDPAPGEYRYAFIHGVGRRIAYVVSVTRSLDVIVTYAVTCRLGTVRWSKPTAVFFVDIVKTERPTLYEIESVTTAIGQPLASLKAAAQ